MNNKPVIVIDECAKLRPLCASWSKCSRAVRALLPDVPCTLRTLVLYMLPCFVLPFSAGNFIITLNNTLFDE